MTFKVERSGDRTFSVEGELDLETAPLLREMVAPTLVDSENVMLKLDGLTFVGSDGIRAFVEFCKALGPGHVVLLNPQPQVMHVLRVTHVLRDTNLIFGYSS